MSVGCLCVFYRSQGWQAEVYNQEPLQVWLACLHIMLETFRFNNPHLPILVLDIDNQLDEENHQRLSSFATVVPGEELKGIHFNRETNDKLLALGWSPFSETALIDLDFLITGSFEDIFAVVTEPLGVLHYPGYRRTANRINSGVIVVKDQAVLEQLEAQRQLSGLSLMDEDIIDRAMSEDRVRATLIPDVYGKSKQMWWARNEQDLTASCASKWVGALTVDWQEVHPVYRLGDEVVRAFHFSSAKSRMVTDTRVQSYLAQIHAHQASESKSGRD